MTERQKKLLKQLQPLIGFQKVVKNINYVSSKTFGNIKIQLNKKQ